MYANRAEAAAALAERLKVEAGKAGTVIAGIPPAGAIVGAQVALKLDLPFACSGVYKVPMAARPDATLAVIDMDGEVTLDPKSELTRHEVQKRGASTLARLHADLERCRGDAKEPDFAGATVIVVDHAVFSTLVVRAAVACIKRHGAKRVILATPVIGSAALEEASREFDEVIALNVSHSGGGLDRSYVDHSPPTEDELLSTVRVAYARQV